MRHLLADRGEAVVNLAPSARADLQTIRETRAHVPLLLQDMAALNLMACVRSASRLGVSMAEAGVFMGGSARLICAAKGGTPLHLFDAFETLQASPEEDSGSAEVRTYFSDFHGWLADVRDVLAGYDGVHFHPGHFPGTATALGEQERFGFVHLDLDLAEGTRDGLRYFWPRMVPGAILLGDDYWLPGVREAFESFFAGRPESPVTMPWSQVMVVKAAD